MRVKVFFSLVCAVVLCAVPCHGNGMQEQKINVQTGELLFIGVSGKLSRREDTIQAALRDAARRLSFFHSVSGYIISWEHIGGKTFDFRIETKYRLQYDNDLEKFVEALEFNPHTDIFEHNNALFVITHIKSDIPMPRFRGHSFRNERPRWIDTPPAEIEGFIAGTGLSSRLSSHSDTVIKSYENAVIGIIENMKSHVNGGQKNYQNNSGAFDSYLDSSNETGAQGKLKNFYIIESWTDPKNLSVWTLAVAQGGESTPPR
ncbi:MAG: hypothetical protein LBB89_06230 [Treponema sp.]|nr:hypothetical protein [Treponema sp.]